MIFRQIPPTDQPFDICIVGAGPVGLSLAFEFEDMGLRAIILESGSDTPNSEITAASRAFITNPTSHAPMEIAVCRALGGTSWAWGGRCVPFDDVDFVARPQAQNYTWPIEHCEVKRWYSKAARYLCCGSDLFEMPPKSITGLGGSVLASSLERWSAEPRLAMFHKARIERSRLLTFCLNSTVVDLQFDHAGTVVEGAVVANPTGKRCIVRSKHVILATGGVEATRLLLAVQRRLPNHFGGVGGPLGRYYMGHLSGKIATIAFSDPSSVDDLDFQLDGVTGSYFRRRLTLSRETQTENGVLNTAFWPDNPPFYDPSHRSGVFSAVFLALAFPPVGRRLASEAIRLFHIGPRPHRYWKHLQNIILGAFSGSRDIVTIIHNRLLTKPRKPGFLIKNPRAEYALHFHAEQAPNPDSRITLTNETDPFGLPRATIDLRFGESDALSAVRSHQILDSALRASNIGRLNYLYPEHELAQRVGAQAADGFHQIGTTRMGKNQRESVVDSDLNVHGVHNLHVASSSVFPTAGQANSTLLAVALAIRLAHHLSEKIASETPTHSEINSAVPSAIGT